MPIINNKSKILIGEIRLPNSTQWELPFKPYLWVHSRLTNYLSVLAYMMNGKAWKKYKLDELCVCGY